MNGMGITNGTGDITKQKMEQLGTRANLFIPNPEMVLLKNDI